MTVKPEVPLNKGKDWASERLGSPTEIGEVVCRPDGKDIRFSGRREWKRNYCAVNKRIGLVYEEIR